MSEVISTVDGILYNTDEIRYTTAENYDDEGKLTGETAEAEPTICQKTASCKLYEAEVGWFGLMSSSGKIIDTVILQPLDMTYISVQQTM